MLHILKIQQRYADEIIAGNKMFEVRLNDKHYQKGDCIQFICTDSHGLHKIDTRAYDITYVLSDFPQALKENYVVLGIKDHG